jgi:hypothetical protein
MLRVVILMTSALWGKSVLEETQLAETILEQLCSGMRLKPDIP